MESVNGRPFEVGEKNFLASSVSSGCGSSIKFWHDSWCGGQPLKELCPELFCTTHNKEASVADLLSFWRILSTKKLVLLELYKIVSWTPSYILWTQFTHVK